MAIPLKTPDTIIKLPLSVSSLRGSALYLRLRKALNGLIASMEWINFLSEIAKKTGSKGSGLKGCSIEPCLFTGFLESAPCGIGLC